MDVAEPVTEKMLVRPVTDIAVAVVVVIAVHEDGATLGVVGWAHEAEA